MSKLIYFAIAPHPSFKRWSAIAKPLLLIIIRQSFHFFSNQILKIFPTENYIVWTVSTIFLPLSQDDLI
ncbi:MAG: hypothetical protein WBV73_05760 [Phormidium sp.]